VVGFMHRQHGPGTLIITGSAPWSEKEREKRTCKQRPDDQLLSYPGIPYATPRSANYDGAC
jgi:hypothetical protein